MAVPARDRAKAIAIAKKAGWNPSWIRDPHDVRAVLDGCSFDEEAGQHVVDFFLWFLKHSKGKDWAGKPFALLAWEEDVCRRLFGWKRADGTRRFRRGGIWIAKKNGKSTLAAGIELYMLVGDDEPGAEVYSGANDRSQAGIIYREAAQMVRTSPHLRKRLKPVDTTKTIAYPGSAGFLQALSADVPTKEGINAHAVIIDELHAMKKRDLWDTLEFAGAARRQPLMLVISTAGVYNEQSIAWEQYQYAKRVLSDEIKDWAFFAVVYEAGPKDDWTKPKTWKKANPSLGITIDETVFAEECRAAQQSPARQNSFKRYRLNQWTQQTTRAIDLQVWDGHRGHDIAAESFRGRACYSGLDIASVSDLTAAVHVFPCDEDEEALDILLRIWIPEAQLTNEKNPNRALYQQWVDEGHLEATPGNVIDYDMVIAQLLEDAGAFEIRDLAYDRLFQGQHVANRLSEEGINVFPMGQGFLSMGPAYREFERLHLAGKLHHGGHPGLRWAMENLQVAQDAHQNKKIVKPQGHLKVDPAVALVQAIDRVRRHGAGEDDSVYDSGGVFTVGEDLET